MNAPSPLEALLERIGVHLATIYGEGDHTELTGRLVSTMRIDEHFYHPVPYTSHWNERDVALITYGDSILKEGENPLATLSSFVDGHLSECISIVHILPFFPWTSDDGFAVSDYEKVNPELGDWTDVEDIATRYRVMSDLVINHCSASHEWFKQYERSEKPGCDFFVEVSPGADLSLVTRPRISPLRRPTETANGMKHVWCTFGHDQVDLNFRSHELLVEMVRIIRGQLDHGVGVFRLDAVAFLWKEIGTNCINLPQTHEIIRLFRTLIEHVKPNAVIITETNIPNQENLSYFGNMNEAHCIYNFSLPPLLLHAMTSGSSKYLKSWLMRMPAALPGTAYFNFIASHDGIGLRPAEGLLEDREIEALVNTMKTFGGRVSSRALPDGSSRPYEINISLFDAMQGTSEGKDDFAENRFVAAHAVLLSLEGIPAFYIHSLLGTRNDYAKADASGVNRHLNRHQWQMDEIEAALADPENPHARILARLKRLMAIRRDQTAFHPNATQFTLHLGDSIFAYWRQSVDRKQNIFCFHNVSKEPQDVSLSSVNLAATEEWIDLISGEEIDKENAFLNFAPYQCIWLANKRKYLPY